MRWRQAAGLAGRRSRPPLILLLESFGQADLTACVLFSLARSLSLFPLFHVMPTRLRCVSSFPLCNSNHRGLVCSGSALPPVPKFSPIKFNPASVLDDAAIRRQTPSATFFHRSRAQCIQDPKDPSQLHHEPVEPYETFSMRL